MTADRRLSAEARMKTNHDRLPWFLAAPIGRREGPRDDHSPPPADLGRVALTRPRWAAAGLLALATAEAWALSLLAFLVDDHLTPRTTPTAPEVAHWAAVGLLLPLGVVAAAWPLRRRLLVLVPAVYLLALAAVVALGGPARFVVELDPGYNRSFDAAQTAHADARTAASQTRRRPE